MLSLSLSILSRLSVEMRNAYMRREPQVALSDYSLYSSTIVGVAGSCMSHFVGWVVGLGVQGSRASGLCADR